MGSNEERIQPILPLSKTTLRGKRQKETLVDDYNSGHVKSFNEERKTEPSHTRPCDTEGPSSATPGDVHEQLHSILQEQHRQAAILDHLLDT